MKSMLIVAAILILSSSVVPLAYGKIIEAPVMSACVKKDRLQKTIDDNLNSPDVFFENDALTIDFSNTAFASVSTTANDNERIVTALCSGRVGFSFDQPYQLDGFSMTIDRVKFESAFSLDDYVKVKVRGFVSSEEGNNSFESRWPDVLRAKDFKGKGPYQMNHSEQSTVCGQRLTLRIDQMEAQARRSADRDSSNQVNVSRLVFRFVPCRR